LLERAACEIIRRVTSLFSSPPCCQRHLPSQGLPLRKKRGIYSPPRELAGQALIKGIGNFPEGGPQRHSTWDSRVGGLVLGRQIREFSFLSLQEPACDALIFRQGSPTGARSINEGLGGLHRHRLDRKPAVDSGWLIDFIFQPLGHLEAGRSDWTNSPSPQENSVSGAARVRTGKRAR